MPDASPEYDDEPFGVVIDGEEIKLMDLTFRERRELRAQVRANLGRDDAEIVDVIDDSDVVPPFIWLVKRRTDPTFSLEDAEKITGADLRKWRNELEEKQQADRPPAEPADAGNAPSAPAGDPLTSKS